ncbi:pentapeptide repeat-containing protein [uncultured Desulfobacter sp.]|uniref:pentapeptide repeat-containing protein n=1 Tax=uncultured Desulfobacter sp. TaxID=240139 RepID=UPI0029F5AD09|nr:pentapeptide repeat-containing protein [uncultured Desulfobacter sp.]
MDKETISISQEEIIALRQRWLEPDLEAGTDRRAVMLRQLKADCPIGKTNRPITLDLRGIDLSNQDLSNMDFSGYDLSFAILNRVNLSRSNLSYGRLTGASLEKAVLDECEFIGVDLSHAGLNECRASHCGFGGADLSHASLINANLSEAVLSRSKLCSADLRASDLTGARMSEADLSHAVFTRASLCDADLKHSNLNHTLFSLADLRRCRLLGVKNFKKANWVGADIRDMDLRGAYLVRRHISDENYLFEFKSQSRMHNILYWIWWFTSDCGRSLVRWLVWLVAATLGFGLIYTQVDIYYGDYPTWFSPIYFSFVTLTTLGYGDAVPMSLSAQIVVSLQAVTGYMGLGGLLSILGNKMARRAE